MTDRTASKPLPESSSASWDWELIAAHVSVPALAAWGFSSLLSEGEWSVGLFASVLPLLAIGLRPAVWGIAASLRSRGRRSRVGYVERRDNAANVSLVTMSGLGLALMDVLSLPGRPHWTNQPSAGLLLAAIAVYLVWLATYANVPREVKEGWAELIGWKGTH